MALDQEKALILFERGATLILLDVPEGTEFGIDLKSWYVGPKFKGIKMIPPGPHFFFYSAVDKYGQHALRNGMFIFTGEMDIFVMRWDNKTEDFSDPITDTDEIERFKNGLKGLDSNLGPYPYEIWNKWKKQTSYISQNTLKRLNPPCGKLTPLTEIDNLSVYTKKELEKLTKCTSLSQDESRIIGFTKLPQKRYPEGSSPKDITKYNMDSSYVLQTLLSTFNKHDENEILGEAQFAFVAFLFGHVYDAFEHWKNIVHLFSTSEEIISTTVELFCNFTEMLQQQLLEIPEDFFVDIVSKSNFLVQTLKVYFDNFETPGEYSSKLERYVGKLKSAVVSKFNWDFNVDNPEDEPVIVDI